MSRKARFRPDHRRAAIANEAARITQEQGITDFRFAKEKAVERLGLRNTGPLPSNAEIEAALAERNRIFRGDQHLAHLRQARAAAMAIMQTLQSFYPRLVGSVLSGHTTEHAAIQLHLFSDAVEAVGVRLDALGINHRTVQNRHRLRRGQVERFPGYRFIAKEFDFATTVFPERSRRQAPLSPVDGRPMRRANLRELARLVDGEPPT